MARELCVGITSWNSALFLGLCIDAIRLTTSNLDSRIIVADNGSSDASVEIAREHGAEVVSSRGSQAMALNMLLNMSRSRRTLLIHSDVILLSRNWYDICNRCLTDKCALVSPEDIGCGPYTRPWGVGKPESSFLLFDTEMAKSMRQWYWRQRFKMRLPHRALDLFGEHVTYNLPAVLRRGGLTWTMMEVHTSTEEAEPFYAPHFKTKYWNELWGRLRYELGNFYSINGIITHYHNWFDRVQEANVPIDSTEMVPREGGFPLAFLKLYTDRFLSDLRTGAIIIPKL